MHRDRGPAFPCCPKQKQGAQSCSLHEILPLGGHNFARRWLPGRFCCFPALFHPLSHSLHFPHPNTQSVHSLFNSPTSQTQGLLKALVVAEEQVTQSRDSALLNLKAQGAQDFSKLLAKLLNNPEIWVNHAAILHTEKLRCETGRDDFCAPDLHLFPITLSLCEKAIPKFTPALFASHFGAGLHVLEILTCLCDLRQFP